MPSYRYLCDNEKCESNNKIIEIDKKMSECDREEFCEVCGNKLVRSVDGLICGTSICKCGGFYRNNN